MTKMISRIIANFLLTVSLVYFALFSAWYISYHCGFFFPVIYGAENIAGHIEKFAPQNRHGRSDFALTDRDDHFRIFDEMLTAVENGGKGLGDIRYSARGTGRKFLTMDEQIHLQDVANLLTVLRKPVYLMAGLLILSASFMVSRRIRPMRLVAVFFSGAVLGIVSACAVAVVGFVDIFYFLHELVFPAGHKWFFYYQDSLMSTMLKAPDSFAWMGGILGVISVLMFIVYYTALSRMLGRDSVQ